MRTLLYVYRRVLHELRGRVVHLVPNGHARGAVLLSYTTLPYLDTSSAVLDAHTNRWECMQMARTFLARGYAVDVIDATNHTFIPKRQYRYFIDVGPNMDRLAPILGNECIKIFHITHAHWKYQNEAEVRCAEEIKKKRSVTVNTDRAMAPSHAIELCDGATSIAGNFAHETYSFAQKKIVRIPLSTTHTYPSPEHKDFERVRRNFIWFGGAGLALKRLDLVLEAFARMPEYRLTICGKINPNDPFVRAYQKELFETPNISVLGWTDPGSNTFELLRNNSLGIVYPSASEGCAGSVVTAMHAGLIPIVSVESGIDADDVGFTLRTATADDIAARVHELSSLPVHELRARAVGTWHRANERHTRESFTRAYDAFVDTLISTAT